MDKLFADRIIEEYFHKIYGFAVKKSYSTQEAEELCAEMIKEVYLSLRKMGELVNVEGYVWRICENTFAKYVSLKKKKQGISLDGIVLPYYDDYDRLETEAELQKLRLEIAFLTKTRRKAVYAFYYEGKSVMQISAELGIPEGTVKWHLNRARNELKEGIDMERKVGKLGLSPIDVTNISHNGNPGNDGPENYLLDKINVNIVYSVYWTPRTLEEIADELGMTPVFLEDKVAYLEANGFLVKTAGNRYTTYVNFGPKSISLEKGDHILQVKAQAAKILAEQYVPKVREAIADFCDVYIPSGNRQLFEAAVIAFALAEKCGIPVQGDLSKYRIRTLKGADYIVTVGLEAEISDPDYKITAPEAEKDYGFCGSMRRDSAKYEGVESWSMDSRFCSRKGGWENNLYTDYEYLYESMAGMLTENAANAEKYARLRERGFLTEDGKVNIMVVKGRMEAFFDRIPEPDRALIDQFADFALEQAMQKDYPPQMQDLVVSYFVGGFISQLSAMMVLDILYENGTFRALTDQEKVTSQLLMFCDRLPKE